MGQTTGGPSIAKDGLYSLVYLIQSIFNKCRLIVYHPLTTDRNGSFLPVVWQAKSGQMRWPLEHYNSPVRIFSRFDPTRHEKMKLTSSNTTTDVYLEIDPTWFKMVRLLRHRQTKGAETDGLDLTLPRHISTLPIVAYVRFCRNWILKNVRSSLKFYYQRHKLPG